MITDRTSDDLSRIELSHPMLSNALEKVSLRRNENVLSCAFYQRMPTSKNHLSVNEK